MMNNGRYKQMLSFITSQAESVKDNAITLKEQLKTNDKLAIIKSALPIIGKLTIVGVLVALVILCVKFIRFVASPAIVFFTGPQYTALATVVKGFIGIFAVALVINLLQKKPEGRTEREQDSMKKTLQRDLYGALTALGPMYGLERPQNIGDISGFEISPCDVIEGIDVYTFSIEKNTASERTFEPSRFKQSLKRRLEKMERENMLTTVNPYGYVSVAGENISSILIFGVEDCGDYVNVRCARTDEDSLALYRRLAAKQVNDNATPNDPDF